MAIRFICSAALAMAASMLIGCERASDVRSSLEVERAWARATAPGQETGGVFLTIVNGGGEADRLLGGSTPAAASVEIHSMTMDGNNVMRMRRQKEVTIASGASAELEPGGVHLMLMGVQSPLAVGRRFPLTLRFAKAGAKDIEVKVLPIGSSGPKEGNDE